MISVFALCGAYIELDRASMLEDLSAGQPWTVPVTSFLVVHLRGRQLFDTGVHCQARLDPLGRLGAERAKRLSVELATLRRLRDQAGAAMFSGHDPEQWRATPRAPAPIAI